MLENIKTGLKVELPPNNLLDTNEVIFTKNKGLNLQILPFKNTMGKSEVYIPLQYASPVIFNIPGTNLVMVKNNQNDIGWAARILTAPDVQNTFKIYSTDPKKVGAIAYFDEKVYITYQDIFILVYDESLGILKAIYEDYNTAVQEKRNIYFRFIPREEAYYCDGKKCKKVLLKNTEKHGVKARYKGSVVTRHPGCWNLCKSTNVLAEGNLQSLGSSPPHRFKWGLIVLIIAIILGTVLLILCCRFLWKKRKKSRY